MNDLTPIGELLRGFVARAAAPIADRAPLDADRLGIPRQRLDPRIRRAVLDRDEFTCVWCFASARRNHRLHLEADHIVPWSAGGADHPVNLRTLCQPCNQARSNRVHALDIRRDPIVWRCATCETGPVGNARLIDAYCLVCRTVADSVYVADLMVGGPIPIVGVPALRTGEPDVAALPIVVRGVGRRRAWFPAGNPNTRSAARAELDRIRPTEDLS